MLCYTLDGKTVDFWEFCREKNIGQGVAGSSDPLYLTLISLKPGESYVHADGWTLARKTYDGDFDADQQRLLELSYKDDLSDEDMEEMRTLGDKIATYLGSSEE